MNHRELMRRREKKEDSEQFAAGNSQTRPAIELRIDELVLWGADFTGRERIADAVQSELEKLLSDRGLPQRALVESTRESIQGGVASIPRGASAKRIGSEIARTIYGGLTSGRRGQPRAVTF
jgi:hypothetical protein